MANAGEVYRPRHGGPALRQPVLDQKAPDEYVEPLNFEIEVTNILQTKTMT